MRKRIITVLRNRGKIPLIEGKENIIYREQGKIPMMGEKEQKCFSESGKQ